MDEPDFQNGDSVYCLGFPKEIEQANARIQAGIADGSVYEQMARAVKKVEEIGEAAQSGTHLPRPVIIVGQNPNSSAFINGR